MKIIRTVRPVREKIGRIYRIMAHKQMIDYNTCIVILRIREFDGGTPSRWIKTRFRTSPKTFWRIKEPMNINFTGADTRQLANAAVQGFDPARIDLQKASLRRRTCCYAWSGFRMSLRSSIATVLLFTALKYFKMVIHMPFWIRILYSYIHLFSVGLSYLKIYIYFFTMVWL